MVLYSLQRVVTLKLESGSLASRPATPTVHVTTLPWASVSSPAQRRVYRRELWVLRNYNSSSETLRFRIPLQSVSGHLSTDEQKEWHCPQDLQWQQLHDGSGLPLQPRCHPAAPSLWVRTEFYALPVGPGLHSEAMLRTRYQLQHTQPQRQRDRMQTHSSPQVPFSIYSKVFLFHSILRSAHLRIR